MTQPSRDSQRPSWMLVETVHADRTSVVSVGGRVREMSSLPRAIRALVGGKSSPQVLGEVMRSVERVRTGAHGVDTTIPTGATRTRMILHPVVGPGRSVHGIYVWIGDSELPPGTVPRDALAVTFEVERRAFVVEGDQLRQVIGDAAIDERTSFTPPEVFRHVDVDDAMSAIGALLSPRADDNATWSGLASAHGRRLHIVFTVTAGTLDWRGLVHAVESDTAATPRLESVAFAALGQVSPQVALVLMDVTHNRLIRWLTDPPPDIQWKGIVDDRDTPHPDDVERIFSAAAGLFAGTDTQAAVNGVRLRRIGGGWTVVDARSVLLPRESGGPGLMLVQMIVVGTSDDPDPVKPGDSGHSSLRG